MKTFPYRFMAHSDGRIIPIPDEDDNTHSEGIIKNPEAFGTSHEELRKITPMGLLSGGASNDFSIQQHMASKGWLRGTHSAEVFERDGEKHTEHHFNLSQEGNEGTPEHFMKPVETLRDLHTGPSHSNVMMLNGLAVSGEGSKKWESAMDRVGIVRHKSGTPGSLALTQTDHINKFVGSGSIKKDRSPPPTARVPTSTEVRTNMGTKPPEMMQAQWNMLRTIGDSYKSEEYPTLLENIIHRLFSSSPVNKKNKNNKLIPPVTKVTPIDTFTPSLPKPNMGIYDRIKKIRNPPISY